MYFKKVSLFFVICSLVLLPYQTYAATTITNGMNATQVIGQSDIDGTPLFTKAGGTNAPDNFGVSNPAGIAIDSVNHRLFLADMNNNRVLIYNLDNTNSLINKYADYVLGQSDFNNSNSDTSQTRMSNPSSVAYDSANNILFVVDRGNNRVLTYNLSGGITNGMNASRVLGQTDFVSSGNSAGQAVMDAPSEVVYDSVSSTLYVSDTNNNHILVYNLSGGITNGMNASYVLGQADFTASALVASTSTLVKPHGLFFDSIGKRLFVGDSASHRVIVYDLSSSITNGMDASYVLGQTSFIDGSYNTSQSGLYFPTGVFYDVSSKRLFVSDSENHRVMVYNLSSGITNGMNASYVLGQTDFTSGNTHTSQSGFYTPNNLLFNSVDGNLYVSDTNNNRVMIFDASSITNGENAINEFGQNDDNDNVIYTKGGINNIPNRRGFSLVSGTVIDPVHHRLFAADYYNARVLVYNLDNDNILIDYNPDYVLGQSDFYTKVTTVNQANLTAPAGVALDQTNNLLFVSDTNKNRIMVYNLSSGITNGMNASYVLGQADFTSSGSASASQNNMVSPWGLDYDATNKRLFVADNDQNRIIVYNLSSGITNGMNASYVLGQMDFASSGNDTSQSRFDHAMNVNFDSVKNRLYVADTTNNRIMIYDLSGGITNGMNASYVLGQTDFLSNGAGATQSNLNGPSAAAYDANNNRLFVADNGNYRIMIYDLSSGITNGMNASYVLGQTDFTSNSSDLTQSKFIMPLLLTFDSTSGRLYISDTYASRIMVFKVADASSNTCPTVSHATSYNSYPTCGASACESGYNLSSGSCVAKQNNGGGGSYIPSAPKVVTTPVLVGGSINSGVSNVAQMAISTSPDFSNTSWVPYNETYKTTDKVIYVKFMSNDGGVSSVYKVEPQITTVVGSNTPAITATTPLVTANYQFKRILKLGMVGDDVKQLQIWLNNHGFTLSNSGAGSSGKETTFFGAATKKALILMQKKYNLSPFPGYTGPGTRKVLNNN